MNTLATSPRWLREYPGPPGVRLHAGTAPPAASEHRLLTLQGDIIRAFPEYRLSTYFTERPAVLAGADHVIVARHQPSGALLGIVAARRRRDAADGYLHVEMNLITADHQQRGLLLPLWRVLVGRLASDPEGFPHLLAMKTYNPMVYSCLLVVARLSGAQLYPPVLAGDSGTLHKVAERVAAGVAPGCAFDARSGVVCGAGVPRDFYPAMPTTARREVQRYFETYLAPGDRLLCLLHFGPDADVRPLLRRWNFDIDLPTKESTHA